MSAQGNKAKQVNWQSRMMSHVSPWGYEENNGPNHWADIYPEIGTYRNQSPVNLDSNSYSRKFPPLVAKYEPDCCQTVTNNGHSLQVSGIPQDSYVTGGPLGTEKYRFDQFHMHWGPDCSCGSEHCIDGKAYSGEIHIVNWNSNKFSDISSAVADMNFDGICVLGILLEAGPKYKHREFDELTSNGLRVPYPNSKALVRWQLDFEKLLPDDPTDYYYYKGSLTTPPCTECARWIVFAQPIKVNSASLDRLRQLQSGDGTGPLSRNFRPVQPLNERRVTRSIPNSEPRNSTNPSSSDQESE